MDGYPAPVSGSGQFPLTSEIRLRPDCMWDGRSDFHELQYPVLHWVRCHCAVNSWYQPRKICPWSPSIDVGGRRQCALAPTAAPDQVPRLPAACRPPIMSALYTFDARDAVATRCVDTWCFTEIRKYESVNIISTSVTRPASSSRWRFIARPTSSQWYRFSEL